MSAVYQCFQVELVKVRLEAASARLPDGVPRLSEVNEFYQKGCQEKAWWSAEGQDAADGIPGYRSQSSVKKRTFAAQQAWCLLLRLAPYLRNLAASTEVT